MEILVDQRAMLFRSENHLGSKLAHHREPWNNSVNQVGTWADLRANRADLNLFIHSDNAKSQQQRPLSLPPLLFLFYTEQRRHNTTQECDFGQHVGIEQAKEV